MSFSVIALIILIVAVAVFSMVTLFGKGEESGLDVVWGSIAIVIICAGLILCAVGTEGEPLAVKASSDPSESVNAFFSSISAGDYETAYSYLADCDSLGLEFQPESPEGALVYGALIDSFSFTPTGECRQDKLTAVQTVRIRYLNIPRLEAAVEQGEEEDYLTALGRYTVAADNYYETEDIRVTLKYSDGWLVVADEDLLNALKGGVS